MEEMIYMSEKAGFAGAALVDTKDIPFEPGFLVCC